MVDATGAIRSLAAAAVLAALLAALASCRGGSDVPTGGARPQPATAAESAPPASGEPPAGNEPATSFAPVAVVELFTSEGCSSCPAADEQLRRLVDERAQASVFALSFHVDYWDPLGWRDRFAKAAFSERQRRYARAITRSDRVYTPQIVVGGQQAFVGSRGDTLAAAVERALDTPAEARIELEAGVTDASDPHRARAPIVVRYAVESSHASLQLNLVTLQRRAESRVGTGENAGRTLEHRNVVRGLSSVTLEKKRRARASGRWYTRLPKDLPRDNALLLAYAELPGGRVVGASAVAPPAP